MHSETVTTCRGLSWRAILAGALIALSIHLLLTTLGAGISALIARPANSDAPAQSLAIGLAVSWTLSALVSLWVGGCIAGKLSSPGDAEGGIMHGFAVWSLSTVLAFVLLAVGVGKALHAAASAAVGAGSVVAGAAATVAPDLAKQAGTTIDAYSAEFTPAGQPLKPATKRQIAYSLRNWLATGDAGRTAVNRQAVIDVLSKDGAMAPEEAARTADEWAASFDRVRADLEATAAEVGAKAREAADKSASATGKAAIWTFVAFWIGAAFAVWGGRQGALGCSPGTRASATKV